MRGPHNCRGVTFPMFKAMRVSDAHLAMVFNRPSVFASPAWMTIPFEGQIKNAHMLLADILLNIPGCIALCSTLETKTGNMRSFFTSPLPPGIDLSAYRIVQEALTNTLKHAGPARAWVAVRYAGDDVEIEVENDGRSGAEGDGAGHGLVGMRERVAMCGGELHSGPRPGGGYRISARLPVAGSA